MKKLILALTVAISFGANADKSVCNNLWYKNEVPHVKYDKEICFKEFSVIYSNKDKSPIAVSEYLTPQEMIDAHSTKRKDAFHVENKIDKAYQVKPSDYSHTGFDRGHMAPAGDMPNSDDQYESFSMANMTPQIPELNRKAWRLLEAKVRDEASKENIWVVTGAVFSDKSINGISIPTILYKAVKTDTSEVIYLGDNLTGEVNTMTPEQFKIQYGITPFVQ